MIRYVAFLRGINSGMNPNTKMDVLRNAFEELGFQNVKTVIASGNVLFDAAAEDEKDLEQRIEKALPKAIGFQSATIVYKFADLQKLAKLDALKTIAVIKDTRIYVTFLKEPPKKDPGLNGTGFKLLKRSGRALFTHVDLSGGTTPDLMKVLDREFGRTNTTRGWKTIERILEKG